MFCFCSDATLRRYCVQCTTASFEEFKEATRFRERWRFRVREISQTLPIRHADEVARFGALSPLGGYSREDPEEQESSYPTEGFGRSANFEEVMTAYGSWLDRQGARTSRTSVRASNPKATEVEECVGATRRLPATSGNPSRWHTVIEGNFKFKEAIHMKEDRAALMGLRRAVAGTAGHGHRFLSLRDNMSSLLAFDRGRSCSHDLHCLRRRAAAQCVGADVMWVLRHLEKWRNPYGLCEALPSHLPLNMFLELSVSNFASILNRLPRSPLRPVLAVRAQSLSFVMAIRGSLLLFGGAVPMSLPAAIWTLSF